MTTHQGSHRTRIVPRIGLMRQEIIDVSPHIPYLDEWARLLEIVRHNRLIDRFLNISTCSFQRYLSNGKHNSGDEVYVGIDKKRIRSIVPVIVLRDGERISKHRYLTATRFCRRYYPSFNHNPVFVSFLRDEFSEAVVMQYLYLRDGQLAVMDECHYEMISVHALLGDDEGK